MSTTTTQKLVRPLGDYCLLRVIEEKFTPGGITIPDSAQQKNRAEVVNVGPGIEENGSRTPMRVRPGETVIFHRHCGTTIDANDEKLLLIRQGDILATIK